MSIAASRLQQRRRDQERIFHDTQCFLDHNNNTQLQNEWEEKTKKQVEQRSVDAITKLLLQEQEDELNERKQELQSLYNNDMSQWKQTLHSSLEVSPADRMEQIRKRAFELKAKREEERQVFVKECYEQQWRDQCDDLRALESQATLDRIVKDREQQIIENKRKKDSVALVQNEPQCSLINKDETLELSQRKKSSLDFRRALDQQVQRKASLAESAAQQKQEEEKGTLGHLANLEQQALFEQAQRLEQAKRKGQDLLQETVLRANDKDTNKVLQRQQNLLLLEHAMEIERQQIAAIEEKKAFGKEAASEYVKCLREQAVVEEGETQHLNGIREAELERLAKAQDDKLSAEQEYRRRMQQEVDVSRQEQIARKQLERDFLRKEADREAEDTQEALIRAEKADKREAEQADRKRLETMKANSETIAVRAKQRERKDLSKSILQQQMQKDLHEYERRLHSFESEQRSYGR